MARTDQSTGTMSIPATWMIMISTAVIVRWHSARMVHRFSATPIPFFGSGNTATWRMITNVTGLGRVLAIGAYGRTMLTAPPLTQNADLPAEGFVLRLYARSTRRAPSNFAG